jgi:NtrC-family two-component system response regulator AlgB
VDTAVEAMRRGAKDYLPKPFTPAQIRHLVGRAVGRRALERRVSDLETRLEEAAPEAIVETGSPRMQSVLDVIGRAAGHDVAVLLRGENGTGKGVLARLLHSRSPRRDRPFVLVNCPTLSEELLVSELFGHARGAFTGAVKDHEGRVEVAEGGTVFLDEIGEISPGLQAKLLRFLQEKRFERVGETRTRTADVRVVAATNRGLEEEVKAGRFREDLLYRLNVVEVTVPPLRERAEDVLPLARRFVAFFARQGRRQPPELSAEAERVLLAYPWPGNVRELRNAIERALILSPGQVLEPESFPRRIAAQPTTPVMGGDFSAEEIEREHVLRVLARAATLEDAARILGIDVSTLWRKRKKWGAVSAVAHADAGCSRSAGSVNQKLLPFPGSLSTPIAPPCAWVRRRVHGGGRYAAMAALLAPRARYPGILPARFGGAPSHPIYPAPDPRTRQIPAAGRTNRGSQQQLGNARAHGPWIPGL